MTKVSPDVAAECQSTRAACWYSGLRMLFKWKAAKGDKSKDANKILETMDQSPNLYPWEMRDSWGIDAGECRETARLLGLQATGDGELDGDAIEDTLKKRGPIWVAGNWGRGNHVIVITACSGSDGRLRVINPYENYSGSETSMTVAELNKRGSLWKNCDASVMCW
ncbi:MAG TPA: papain-like cysteine protease family protein [Pyrinomonadaceae bacterium]|nr:papain-like cysteine protease family protein [Pyrinomonadaceae bacterium]